MVSCDKQLEPDISKFGYDFFPLETGRYKVYEVQEIVFTDLELPDTLNYQLKELISDSVTSGAGEISYVLQRLKRSLVDDPWELDSIWSTYRNDVQAVVYENNIPILKLVFPFQEGKTWDANSLNSRDIDDFRLRDLFVPLEEYESTVRVLQEEKLDSLISLDNRYEIYAQNIGLVVKVSSILEFCQESDCFGQKIIKEGRILTQSLIEYGSE